MGHGVVYTAEDADQALAYVADYPVDIVTDVNIGKLNRGND